MRLLGGNLLWDNGWEGICYRIMVVRLMGGNLLWDNGCEVGGRGLAVG